MIQVKDLSILFGDKLILDEISFSLTAGEKVGLTGKNGAGKTTLFKLINGEHTADSGTIQLPKEHDIGFLSQHLEEMEDIPLVDEVSKALENLHIVEKQIADINRQLAERTDYTSDSYSKLVNNLTTLTEQYEHYGGSTARGEVETILKGLGFTDADMQKNVSTFSGGWKMRISLAKILLKQPDILLLDEPTNHLDLNSIIWLESWLKNSPCILLVISHDVQFLDNVTSRTLEIENASVYDYPVSYTEYKKQRAERRERLRAAYRNQQKKISQKKRTIERFRAKASKASIAQSMIKELERMDKIELDEKDEKSINLQFQEAPRSGRIVSEVRNLDKNYGKKNVLTGVDLRIERGEKIAFVGQNGQGKTTLARLMIEELRPSEGTAELGYNVEVGYYAQDQTARLDKQATVLETLEAVAPRKLLPKVRTILGSFLFTEDDVYKKVSVLSGGEKSRLAIAALLMHPYNFLVMDEPTNHLDVQSKDILKNALREYNGTLLIVSHDRDFLQDLTSRTIEFRDHAIHNHIGSFNMFMKKRQTDNIRDIEMSSDVNTSKNNKQNQRNVYKKKKNLKRKIQYKERDIEKKEKKINKIEKEMKDPTFYKRSDAEELSRKHALLKNEIAALTSDWEELVEEMDKI